MPIRLFLSYSRSDDAAFVRRLYDGLKAAGFDGWFDRVSMPSRELTFSKEIEDAISACDRLVFVVGPSAVSSDYVTHEWRFAFHQAVRCVNPILRLGDYDIIPEDLRGPHIEDFRDDSAFDFHLANLVRQLSDPMAPLGKLVAVPALPPHYLEQGDRIRTLRDMLLADLQKPVVVSGASGRVGLHGMGGIGKSLLANALAHRQEIRREFDDGVYWVTLGQRPNVTELQRGLVKDLHGDVAFTSVSQGSERLRDLFKDRAALLILDDVWQRDHAEAFNVVGVRCRILLTTRDAGLVTALAAKENHYQVQLPTLTEARAMLAKSVGIENDRALPREADKVIDECGRLPLALALCGGMVYHGTPWSDLLGALRDHDLKFLSDAHSGEEHHANVWKAIDVSLRVLPENERCRFSELAVFAIDTGATQAAIETLWGYSGGLVPRYSGKLLRDFAARSLVQLDSGRMTMHDLVHGFVAGMSGNEIALHTTLLDAYHGRCPSGWASGPNDDYFLQHLVSHLIAANKVDDAINLLTDLPWIETKCKAGLAFDLQSDYRQAYEVIREAQSEVQEEMRRKAELTRWSEILSQCAGEGRSPTAQEMIRSVELSSEDGNTARSAKIGGEPTRFDKIQAFRRFVGRELYSLHHFGSRAGFVSQQAYNSGSLGCVHDAAANVGSATPPSLLRIWPDKVANEPDSACTMLLEGHGPYVSAIAPTADERRLISLASDGLRIWSLETGACLQHLEADNHEQLAVTPNGQIGISAGNSGRRHFVAFWDFNNGTVREALYPHGGFVRDVAISHDGRMAASAGQDKAVIVWDVAAAARMQILRGHQDTVYLVRLLPDGKYVVSGSSDSLRVWEIETGACVDVLLKSKAEEDTIAAKQKQAFRPLMKPLSPELWDADRGFSKDLLQWLDAGLSITPDGRRAVSDSLGEITVWDVFDAKPIRTIQTGCGSGDYHNPTFHCIKITANGSQAITGGFDGTIRVWDLERSVLGPPSERHKSRHHHGRTAVADIAMNVHGDQAVSAGVHDLQLRVWNPTAGTCQGKLAGHELAPCAIAFSSSTRLVSAGYDRTARVWDVVATLSVKEFYFPGRELLSLAVGEQLAISRFQSFADEQMCVWSMDSGLVLRTLRGARRPVVFTRKDSLAVTGIDGGGLALWNVNTGEQIRALRDCSGYFNSLDRARGGEWVVAAADDGAIRIWDINSGEPVGALLGHSHGVHCVKSSFALPMAISVGADKTVRQWNLETRECHALAHLDATPLCCAIDEACTLVAVGTDAGDVRFFSRAASLR